MKRFEYPRINEDATPEVQLKEIRLFLKRLIDELNSGRENVTALSVFNEALVAVREAELCNQNQTGNQIISVTNKELGAAVVALVTAALESKCTYFVEENRDIKRTGLLGSNGVTIDIVETMNKVNRLEKTVNNLKEV
jgi:hypothetical protein